MLKARKKKNLKTTPNYLKIRIHLDYYINPLQVTLAMSNGNTNKHFRHWLNQEIMIRWRPWNL